MGALNEEIDIVGDAQMDIVDLGIDEAHAIVPALRHPYGNIIFSEPAPPVYLQPLAEIILRHACDNGARDDEAENDQLALNAIPIVFLDCIEKS